MISQSADEEMMKLKGEFVAMRDRFARTILDAEYMLGAMLRARRIDAEEGGREVLNLFRAAMGTR